MGFLAVLIWAARSSDYGLGAWLPAAYVLMCGAPLLLLALVALVAVVLSNGVGWLVAHLALARREDWIARHDAPRRRE
jgi:cytochrome c biogenesis protein CcdA